MHPQTKRHLHNAQKLRAAAIHEFAAHGLQGTKVSSIVAAAHLTQPSFYRIWTSKEAAYEEVIAQTLDRWQQVAEQIIEGPSTLLLEKRLGCGVKRLYSALTENIALTHLVLHENSKNPDRYLPFIGIYSRIFAAAQRDGLISDRLAAESLAQMYTAVTERFFIARLSAGNQSITSAVKEVTQLLLPVFQPEETSTAQEVST
ncbi:TetR/AcrR family transcriptional regulator [Deinococcus sp. SM5_A1]|uniref:TetR/AcrR family transcriptional regulator n=1 Tax=Deinococcus sp. SM5_A1 TaxID=3379094 RepID=UPI003859706D